MEKREFEPIENHAVVGNMRSMALVAVTGSIDFLCFPRFDSPTIFASLLDPEKGGHFSIVPKLSGGAAEQVYVPDTNVLLTRYLSEDGMSEITDWMPIPDYGLPHQIMRKVTAVRCDLEFELEVRPRFDYARMQHTIQRRDTAVVFCPVDEAFTQVVFRSSIAPELKDGDVVQTFHLKEGESAYFSIGEVGDDVATVPDPESFDASYAATCGYWRDWVSKGTYKGRWREMVMRSALVLQLMTDWDYGSIVAAPTFGLPEKIGGERNWDYRYTWLRDSSFTLYALIRLGFTSDAVRFEQWLKGLLDYDGKQGPFQVLYAVDGSRDAPEYELDHLRGYRDSKPVRIGNAASTQLQLDIYGEVMDAYYLSSKYGDAPSIEQWDSIKGVGRWLADHWREPDDGIWEVRGGRKKFLHSRLMCWVAFDRMIRLGEKRSLAGPFEWMEECRDAIMSDIHNNFWSEKLQAFVQYEGSETLDASALLMPMMRFISPTDPKWLSTMAAIERELTVDTFVSRYKADSGIDGLQGSQGSFNACSFWLVEALARSHQVDKARLLFEKILGYSNQVGLYAEELGHSGEHLGNFPQALSHLALISAATALDRALQDKHPVWG